MKAALTYLILLLSATAAYAQHAPLYSQYMFNGLAINPAYTGSREVFSVAALHRAQWTGIEGAPETQTLSAHTPLKNNKVGLGLLAWHDRIGVTEQQGIGLSYAYRISLPKGKLSLGISGSITSLRARWSSLELVDKTDAVFLEDSPLYWIPNAGAGCYYYSEKFYAGLSLPAMMTSSLDAATGKYKIGHEPGNYNVFLTSGMVVRAGGTHIKPSVLIKHHQGAPVQVDINTNVFLGDHLEIGGSFRSGDALVGMVCYNINKQFRAGYAYDRTLSALKSTSRGSHEIMLQYEFGYKVQAMSPRYF
jgi:type IX secretion system PorP/SprF family membrane protein